MLLQVAFDIPSNTGTSTRHEVIDLVVFLRVDFHTQPVFFIEIKTAVAIEHLSERAEADNQLRSRLEHLSNQSLSELHGLSALGTRLCFYCRDKSTESVTPPLIPRNDEYVNDTAPADRWNMDILTDDGYSAFMNIVERVKALAIVEGAVVTYASPVTVTFDEYAVTTAGENIFLVGSIPELGSWAPASPIPLSAASYPTWSVTLSIPASLTFQYKFIRKETDGRIIWESEPNRQSTTVASGSQTISSPWR
ncbi:hypothetical protein AX17_004417 [Amanita inopinata Kibby_2008]|nr:hypothetical protein AX17_004417 [Amanita inopinata Kibby_2008]